MGLEQTWRWFGPKDPITLKEVRQTGVVGIVTALHHIPTGDVWPRDEIMKRKEMIEAEGLRWSVAESLPVHEEIKRGTPASAKYIENYKQSIRNLGECGVEIICYNFMPVLDWSRTSLEVEFKDGSITTKFESAVFAAFDLFILKRAGAVKNYTEEGLKNARIYFDSLDEREREKLVQTVLLGFPGSGEAYTLDQLRAALHTYDDISESELRNNLYSFVKEIVPVAESAGVFMALHPDDPPWALLGLPRIMSTKEDLHKVLLAVDSHANGLTLCTGSLGAGIKNNLVAIAEAFADRINFIHLRNVARNEEGDFIEDNHLEGDIDIYGVMKALIVEQDRRVRTGRKDARMPMRPDHGHLMIADRLLAELRKQEVYPGYSLFGRMRGLAELRGMELGIRRSLGL